MWPWDHLALGYLLYTPLRMTRGWGPPDGATAATLALGTQLPDFLDKPLAWHAGVLPSGLSVGHSLGFVAAVTVLAFAARPGRPVLPVTLAVGLVSRLLGDMLFAALLGSPRTYEFVLWPFVPAAPEPPVGLFASVMDAWSRLRAFLATATGRAYLVADAAMLWAAVVCWIRDGMPGTGVLRRGPDTENW
jgi:hypothetical protein